MEIEDILDDKKVEEEKIDFGKFVVIFLLLLLCFAYFIFPPLYCLFIGCGQKW